MIIACVPDFAVNIVSRLNFFCSFIFAILGNMFWHSPRFSLSIQCANSCTQPSAHIHRKLLIGPFHDKKNNNMTWHDIDTCKFGCDYSITYWFNKWQNPQLNACSCVELCFSDFVSESSKFSDNQAIEYIHLPVKFIDKDAQIVVRAEPWPIIDIHSIMGFLFEEAGVNIPSTEIAQYWARSRECGEPFAQDVSNHHRVPIGIYGDSAKVRTTFDSENVMCLFTNLVLWRPRSVRWSRFLLCCIPEERCTSETLPTILRRVVWSANHAWHGFFPQQGYRGGSLSGKAALLAGSKLTSRGHQFQITEIRGDWAWRKKTFRFHQCHWATLGNICPFCPAKAETANSDDLYWNLDAAHDEFSLVQFLAQRMPPQKVCISACHFQGRLVV